MSGSAIFEKLPGVPRMPKKLRWFHRGTPHYLAYYRYQEKNSGRAEFAEWIGRQCPGRRVFQRVVGNGMAAVVAAVLEEEERR
jgi:hypothetical protein